MADKSIGSGVPSWCEHGSGADMSVGSGVPRWRVWSTRSSWRFGTLLRARSPTNVSPRSSALTLSCSSSSP
eukprot:1686433-Rhodomonas_salina.1